MDLLFSSLILKPLLLTLWLSIVFAFLGVFVVIKRMSFFSDGIAHASIFSLALAFLLKADFLLFALLGAILFSSLIYYLERKTVIHSDALIGLIFVSFLSLGLILVTLKAGYQSELLSLFMGNILTISDVDFWLSFFLSLPVIFFLAFNLSKLTLIFIDRHEALLRGLNLTFYEYLFYLALATVTILGIKIIGIVLVTAFLILPPMIASLISRSFNQMVMLSVVFGLILTLIGFFISFTFNLPLGASIVLIESLVFYVVFVLRNLFVKI